MTEFATEPLSPTALLLRLQQTPFPQVIDSTMISTYSCPQKFFLEYILKLAPEAKSVHLIAGGAFAAALEAARRAYYRDEQSPADALAFAQRAFIQQWGDFDMEGNGTAKTFVNTWAAVESYFEEYPLETDYIHPVAKSDGSPAIEFTIAIPTEVLNPSTGEPILYGGRFDMLAQRDDACIVVDEKTTSSIVGNWAQQWKMRGQFPGYVFGAQMNGFSCNEALVRGIAIQKTQIKHVEVPILYPNYQLERWWTNLYKKLLEMTRRYNEMQTRLETAIQSQQDPLEALQRAHACWAYDYGELCGSYGGCHFLNLCTRQAQWDWYTDYAHREWNPLDRDPTKGSKDLREMQQVQGLSLSSFKD